jgi:hypothetical protein
MPKGPKYFAALDGHVDLHIRTVTVRYPLIACRICTLDYCATSNTAESFGTAGSMRLVLMMKGMLDMIYNSIFKLCYLTF